MAWGGVGWGAEPGRIGGARPDMSLPPEKATELKQLIHQQLNKARGPGTHLGGGRLVLACWASQPRALALQGGRWHVCRQVLLLWLVFIHDFFFFSFIVTQVESHSFTSSLTFFCVCLFVLIVSGSVPYQTSSSLKKL